MSHSDQPPEAQTDPLEAVVGGLSDLGQPKDPHIPIALTESDDGECIEIISVLTDTAMLIRKEHVDLLIGVLSNFHRM